MHHLIRLYIPCRKEGVSVLFGSENTIAVNEYESLKFPGKNTKEIEELTQALKSWEGLMMLQISIFRLWAEFSKIGNGMKTLLPFSKSSGQWKKKLQA